MKRSWILGIGGVALISVAALGVRLAVSPTPLAGPSFTAVMTGFQEVPPVATASSGDATFVLSADGATLTYTVNVTNMTDISASHIHLAMPGVNGPVVVPLFLGPKPGAFTGILAQGTITSAQLSGLLAGQPLSALIANINNGNAYVNVHTALHPGGEIRGIITAVP